MESGVVWLRGAQVIGLLLTVAGIVLATQLTGKGRWLVFVTFIMNALLFLVLGEVQACGVAILQGVLSLVAVIVVLFRLRGKVWQEVCYILLGDLLVIQLVMIFNAIG